MAPRWLSPRQSAWGSGSERVFSLQTVVSVALVVLLIGTAFGFLIGGANDKSQTPVANTGSEQPAGTSATETSTDNTTNPVIAPDVLSVSNAPKSSDGALKAATAFVTGLPNVAFVSDSQQVQVLDNLLSPTAPPAVRQGIVQNLGNIRDQLQTAPGSNQARARMLITPASYRVEQANPEQAKVTVWYMTVVVDGTNQTVRSYWATSIVGLEWASKWQVNALTTNLGPAPPISTQNSQFSTFTDVRQVFDNFKAYRYAPAS